MGIRLSRQKPRTFLLSLTYRLVKFLPFLSSKNRFRFYQNMEWIFDRLSHEASFEFYPATEHPVRKFSLQFILDKINHNYSIVDLGCNMGDISFELAKKAKQVIGIDHNESAINHAHKKYKLDNLKFICEDAHAYFEQNQIKFDVLILSHILEHLEEPDQFLKQVLPYFKFIYVEVPDFDKTYLNHYRLDQNNPNLF